jgi:hypothetical protein
VQLISNLRVNVKPFFKKNFQKKKSKLHFFFHYACIFRNNLYLCKNNNRHYNNEHYHSEDLLALFSITGGVAWYVTLLLDRGKIRKTKMLAALTEENSPFINEGKNILKEASVYELKKDESRYDETTFKEKVATMLDQTPELRKMTIHIGTLSKKDM